MHRAQSVTAAAWGSWGQRSNEVRVENASGDDMGVWGWDMGLSGVQRQVEQPPETGQLPEEQQPNPALGDAIAMMGALGHAHEERDAQSEEERREAAKRRREQLVEHLLHDQQMQQERSHRGVFVRAYSHSGAQQQNGPSVGSQPGGIGRARSQLERNTSRWEHATGDREHTFELQDEEADSVLQWELLSWPISVVEDIVNEIQLAVAEDFGHTPPEGSARHFVMTAALPMLSAYFKRHFVRRAPDLPSSHRLLIDRLAAAIWQLAARLPTAQRESALRCMEEMKAAGAVSALTYLPSSLPAVVVPTSSLALTHASPAVWSRSMSSSAHNRSSRLPGGTNVNALRDVQRKGRIFKANWVNFCRLFAQRLDIADQHTMEGSGARHLAQLLSQRGAVEGSSPPFYYHDVVRQMTSLLSAPKVPPQLTPELMVRLLRVCRALLYLTDDWDPRPIEEEAQRDKNAGRKPGSTSSGGGSSAPSKCDSKEGGGKEGGEGGESIGKSKEDLEARHRAMSKWDMFESSVAVRYSKGSLEALERVQCHYAEQGLAACALRLLSHGNQNVAAEAVKLAVALTDEGNAKVQAIMLQVRGGREYEGEGPCHVGGELASCYLFVRKFGPDAVQPLLQLGELLGY